ncbi:TIGR02450 family Trp-rich protein [Gloeobacter kilaueensis]|uniref:TIGR02450 family Trp-rich protein n=1 Tax=Gloeobacter kilaueensis (strain ATCC BAA-2537 / CCAP 1431/1 / ULC 316 / JS1) TaxID=1183438 RepID=U5QGY9_GLOK1|nr:TIGR02450 family Trp-rich protein [Gloeobacter kilaueensis]AGY58158.1 hypothetical protein GKIL_1912 [Gloeobacter kilaueensis JS1]
MKGRRKIKFPYLLGSCWTATSPLMGWRHFQVIAREERKGIVFALLQSVCAAQIKVWISADNLKNRDLWEPGWLPMSELKAANCEAESAGQ